MEISNYSSYIAFMIMKAANTDREERYFNCYNICILLDRLKDEEGTICNIANYLSLPEDKVWLAVADLQGVGIIKITREMSHSKEIMEFSETCLKLEKKLNLIDFSSLKLSYENTNSIH